MSFNAIITADVKNFSEGVDRAGKEIEKLQLTASEKLAKIGQSFESIGKKASIMSAAIVASGALAVKSFITQEQAERKLDAAISATGGNVEELSKRFREFASDLQGVTTTGDEVTLGMLQMAQTMGLSADQSERAVKNAIAMESAFGVSAASAMRYTAALEDGDATMLKRYIPALKGIEDETLLVAKAQEILGNAFIVAQEDAFTFGGQVTQLKNSFGDLMEQFGAIIAEHIKPMVEGFKRLVDGFLEMDDGTKRIIVAIAGVVAAIGPFLLILGKVIAIAPAVGAAVTAMTGPIGVIVMAIGAAVAAIIHYWDDIKAYFTEGPGASTFTSISEAATKVKDVLIKVFTTIKDVVTKIWDKFGGYITGAFSGVFDTIKAIIDWFIQQVGNVADFFSSIVDGDFSGALDALGNIFTTTFNAILRIVTNIIGQAANIVAGLFDAIGMDKWAAKTKGFADNMIAAYQPVVEETEKATKETEKYAKAQKEAATAAERTAVAVATIARESNIEPIVGAGITMLEVEPVVVPPIDYDPYAQSLEEMNAITLDYGGLIASGLTDFATSIGEAFAEGNFEGLGSGLLGAMGDMISQFGAMLISSGVAAIALKTLIMNPYTAIAAGAALVALGAAATASAQSTVNKATGGGGGGGSMGGTNSYNRTSSLGESSYRGAYRDEWDSEVVFKIGNNELVGTLERANTRRERL